MDFKLLWEKFLNGFDSLEETGKWNVKEHGEMETYCENVLMCVLTKAVFADREATQPELDAFNKMFGFDLDINTLTQILDIMNSENDDILDNPKKTFELIKEANESIYNKFKEVVINACRIIIESDEITTSVENEKLDKFINQI